MIRISSHLFAAFASFVCLLHVPAGIYGQVWLGRTPIHEEPVKLLVVTDRISDTLVTGEIVFTNDVDSVRGMKYLLMTAEGGSWFAQEFPDLRALLENPMPCLDWAAWVHGDGQSFSITMSQAAEIQQLHGINLIVFSWPTLAPDKGPIANFKNSQLNAMKTAGFLHEFLHQIDRYKRSGHSNFGNAHLSIFFHSLGCYMLEVALDNGYLQDMPGDLFDNLVINAAATPSEGHAGWVERLNIQKRLYIASNDGDINLAGLRVISSLGYQLGERPFPPFAENAIYLDFSVSVGLRLPTGATHSYYFDTMTEKSRNVKETYTSLFSGRVLEVGDNGRFESTVHPRVFKVIF